MNEIFLAKPLVIHLLNIAAIVKGSTVEEQTTFYINSATDIVGANAPESEVADKAEALLIAEVKSSI